MVGCFALLLGYYGDGQGQLAGTALLDRMRLHHVAFSRPEKVLVLTSAEAPKAWFRPIWDGLPQWPYVQ